MDEITYLEVPFEDKEKVKSLGARWHSERKKWFVPKGLDTGPFENWLPIYDDRASQKAISPFYLLQSTELAGSATNHLKSLPLLVMAQSTLKVMSALKE
ncbi:hypothetical protein CBQ28_04200 [Pseudoalteromonas sp. GCY]|uniref:DUF5710 domain-containing protein n=1 Tax=unclassified Pseudoalteromonas TaxID=194690 RepID=UPI000BFEC393|nr:MULTISPECIES: DUF5710 domain-containing protein [unclassified Pseudoalteromonas]PHI38292.1 hypothetical protein CBQ28_04200 [Pseudoalteromonas sp. GCY]QQQ65608.1 hypothetical protein JJQ94_14935 [Pseudoalteromonas sp. GCY]QUI70851.1 hypothetical protein GSF13_14310 [Pseudoalteromonas sp. M8]